MLLLLWLLSFWYNVLQGIKKTQDNVFREKLDKKFKKTEKKEKKKEKKRLTEKMMVQL